MLVVQHQWRRWSVSGGQIALPGAQDVDLPAQKAFGWGQDFDYSEEPARCSRLRLEPRPGALWRPLEWRGGAREIEIGLHRPGGLRSSWEKAYHSPDWLFTLKSGCTARVQWNGRFGPRPGIGPCFEDHVYRIGVGDPDPAMFRDRAPDITHERLHLRS